MRQSTEPHHPAYPGRNEAGYAPGMTKREVFAAMALQGLLTHFDSEGDGFGKAAVSLAEDLIAALNERSA